MKTGVRLLLACACALCARLPADAQTLPAEPIVLADGHLAVGGDVSASFGTDDNGAYFNYTDYERSVLRLFRADLTASLKTGDHFSFLAEFRSENIGRPAAYALYVRLRPWAGRAFDIQAGRIPPTFGAFNRHSYPSENPLIGYPLAYQYLTSLRPESLPASADELLKMRGRGWLSSFSVGDTTPNPGVPLASAFQWDTGVQVHAASDLIDGTASLTAGTISHPLVAEDNSGRQLAGRLAIHPSAGLHIGASAARGAFITDEAARIAVGDASRSRDFTQTAFGVDAEYSRDYYLVRAETIVSRWTMPVVHNPALANPLRAIATYVEGRYKIRPGIYAAARLDHLGFSDITGTQRTDTWDAPVTRIEAGGGYSLQRNLLLKASYQHNSRAGGRVTRLHAGVAQVVFWF